MPKIPTEAVRAAADALAAHPWNSYPHAAHREHNFDSACGVCSADLEPVARVVAEAVAPVLAEQERADERRKVAEEIAAAILADADPLIATRTGASQWEGAYRAAHIARKIGHARDPR
ncbi:hypothetical protein [Nonomuraea wenchangensis]|uniref:hypothetical protein n=1 Tax=Nonomuraea wenchangensis TaxID=568860 RepID=UPI00332A4ECA